MKRYGYILLLLSLALPMTLRLGVASELGPDIPEAAKGKQCVEDTAFMRRHHMDLLLHQRDDTMRRGIRTRKHSLKNCFTCHVVKDDAGKAVSVANPRHFCRECHDYAAVQVDCWQCHVSTPSADTQGGQL